ncbi:MAG: DUF4062 domain-containing protein [Candidatus Bathyarchaeota archaeon]|nr:DUF4062 domain-containing protein [Candidatus Bathyarchaeota archaeon]
MNQQRIFVSSTFTDLKDYRATVREAIRKLGHIDISMEHFGARDERALDECLRLIREESDFFVGIYAHRYGFIPKGQSKSIIEAEYEMASAVGLKRFIYLVNEDAPWLPSKLDDGEVKIKLRSLKDRLKADHICSFFSNKDELAAQVAADLGRELQLLSLKHVSQVTFEKDSPSSKSCDIKTIGEWNEFRQGVYEECKFTFIAHTIKPSRTKNQKFDIAIYLLRHQAQSLDSYELEDIDHAEFFLGPKWDDKIFNITNSGGIIGISVSAYGPFLCTCRVTLKNKKQLFLSKYIDFEMESVLK